MLEKSDGWGGAYAFDAGLAQNLREAGFADADTLAKLLDDEKLQQSLAGKAVVLDEAGLIPVKEMNKVFDLAERYQWRVILVGNSKQHRPVQGSSALQLIEERSGLRFAELLENRRQQERQYRAAVNDTRRGNELTEDGKTTYLERAIETLDAQGAIVELPCEQIYTAAAQHHLTVAKDKRGKMPAETKLLSTTTHAEGAAVTTEIRAGLRAAGKLKGNDRQIGTLPICAGRSLSAPRLSIMSRASSCSSTRT